MIRKIMLTICLLITSNAYAINKQEIAGSLEAKHDGKILTFPALSTDITVDIQGDIANVMVLQKFENPTNQALNATYLFPLNKDAAVYAMQMHVGDEIIEAKIKEKVEAEKTFKKAKEQGKAASLLTQHRPNMYTQKVANLMPNMPITVQISYTQAVPKIDNEYELVLPLIVGPRYVNNINEQEEQSIITDVDGWQVQALPEYPSVKDLDIPKQIDDERVSISIKLNAANPITAIYSDTHNIDINGGQNNKSLSLSKGKVIDNADFVLRYALGGKANTAGILISEDKRGKYFSLLIEPPKKPKKEQITAREMVFVLDTSGSMSGWPMNASKEFMKHAMKNLRPNDYFRIIRFNNNASEYNSSPIIASRENIEDGLKFVSTLHAGGGTEIPKAISKAFATKPEKDTMRIVVFLTDGYIGQETEVLRLITEKIGDARIYALGVGTSVNRYLLSEMGRMGRGFTRFINPLSGGLDATIKFANSLESPVLTDIEVDWGDMQVSDVTPSIIPDLFAGDSIRIQGRFKGRGKQNVTLHGKVNNAKASLPIKIDLNSPANGGKAIALLWARTKVADYLREHNTAEHLRKSEYSSKQLRQLITKLGLEYSISTKWTSFVAVSQKVVNSTGQAKDSNIPLPKVKGISKLAYGNANQLTNFAGSSTPEPATIGGMLVLGAAGLAARRRKGYKKSTRKKRATQ